MPKDRFILKTDKITINSPDAATDPKAVWENDWNISFTDEPGKSIGTVSFAGEKVMGTVPITINLEERYQNQGLGTLVLKEMVRWAFLHKGVFEVKATTRHDNDKCVQALEKAGFVFRSSEGLGEKMLESYSIIKPKSNWMGVYLIIGIVIGMVLGIVFGNMWIGMGIGLLICLAFGSSMDAKIDKDRKEAMARRNMAEK